MRDQKARAAYYVWRKCLLHEGYVLVERDPIPENNRGRIICGSCNEYLAIRRGEAIARKNLPAED